MKDIVEYFLKRGIMHNHCGDAEKIIQLREFLRVNNLSAIPKITYNAVYRAQVTTRTNIDLYTLFAWQRMCEVLTDDAPINCQFNADKLLNSLDKIKELMFETSTNTNKLKSTLKSIFADCGVSFEIVHHFRGAPVQGFIKQTDSGKVILCVTIRGKNADRFWFSLFHEIGHLLNGDLNTRFVDFDSVKSEMENKADIFARDTLIDPSLYKSFILSGKYYMLDEIKKFSTSIAVPHWVVIGRLHSDEWLDWNCFAYEIPKFEWAED
jgi:HTH-type transcriptional regulator/antitoxin HigA